MQTLMSNELTPFPSLLRKEGCLARREIEYRENRKNLEYHYKSCTHIYSGTHF
jgi:hypothetical protein